MAAAPREGSRVLGAHVDALAWEQCLAAIAVWAARGESRAVFQCNVHSLVTAFRDAGFASDSVKINVEQLFKMLSPATEIKTI